MKATAGKSARRRILIVNEVGLVREGIANWINACPDLELCGEALDEPTAFEQVG